MLLITRTIRNILIIIIIIIIIIGQELGLDLFGLV